MMKIFAALLLLPSIPVLSNVNRIAIVGTEGSDAMEIDMMKSARWCCNYMNDKRGGIFVDGAQATIDAVPYDYMQASFSEIMGNISIGSDLTGTVVGDIHAVVAATYRHNAILIDECQKLKIPNIHASGGNPILWSYSNSFAYGLHVPYLWYTRDPMRYAGRSGLTTVAIIRTEGGGFYGTSAVAALNWAIEEGLQVIGPSVKWCQQWGGVGNLAPTCRIHNLTCACGRQVEVDSLGFKYALEAVPGFYSVDESAVSDSDVGIDRPTTALYQSILEDIQAQTANDTAWSIDVLVTFSKEYHDLLNAAFRSNFAPKMFMGPQVSNGVNWSVPLRGTTSLEAKLGYWSVGFGQWHEAFKFADPVFGSNANFVSQYRQYTGTTPSYNSAGGVAAVVSLDIALRKYVKQFSFLDLQQKRDSIREAIGDINDETFWGTIRFSRDNQNNGRATGAWQIIPDSNGEPHSRCILPFEAAETALVVPFPTWDSREGCQAGTFNTGSSCEQCLAGRVQATSTIGMLPNECTICSVGTGAAAVGLSMCSACAPGRRQDGANDAGVCQPCPAGFEALTLGSQTCSPCLPGTANAWEGGNCSKCAAGTFASNGADVSCRDCAVGEYSLLGSISCSLCKAGKYQEARGKSACASCDGVSMGSTSVRGAVHHNECVCPRDTYYNFLECVACVRGLSCIAENSLPTQEAGFYAEVLNSSVFHISVYECNDRDVCPAGDLGRCSANRYGRSCAKRKNGSCPLWLPLILCGIGVTFAFIVFWAQQRSAKADQRHNTAESLSIVYTAMVAMNVCTSLHVATPGDLIGMSRFTGVAMVDMSSMLPW